MQRHSELVKYTHIGSKTDPLSIVLPNTVCYLLFYIIVFYFIIIYYFTIIP